MRSRLSRSLGINASSIFSRWSSASSRSF